MSKIYPGKPPNKPPANTLVSKWPPTTTLPKKTDHTPKTTTPTKKIDPTPITPQQPPYWRKHILPQRQPPQQKPCWRKYILSQKHPNNHPIPGETDIPPTPKKQMLMHYAHICKFCSPNMVLDQKMVHYKCEVLQRTISWKLFSEGAELLFLLYLSSMALC